MMLADGYDVARLGPFLAFSEMGRESDFVTDGELLEVAIGHGIAMETSVPSLAAMKPQSRSAMRLATLP